MHNRRYILPGLIIFVAIFSAPFWLNIGAKQYDRPAIELPTDANGCVEPAPIMRAEHMRLLNQWRDAALRDGNRLYTSSSGKLWEVSLQNTCMQCHDKYEQFCERCHLSNSVRPYCWDCHILPKKPVAGGKQ